LLSTVAVAAGLFGRVFVEVGAPARILGRIPPLGELRPVTLKISDG
jgi:hypothetical protein